MKAPVNIHEQGSGREILGNAPGNLKAQTSSRGQRGFTLVELLAVMAIITILAGVVAGALSGLSATGVAAQIKSDNKTLETAADRFFNDAFPQVYPVLPLETDKNAGISFGTVTDPLVEDAGPLGVFKIDFDARLPQDPTLTFTPDFVKEIPNSAALVSYRIDTNTGNVFAAADGAQLIRPSSGRVNVAVGDTTLPEPGGSVLPGDPSDYTFEFRMKRNEAAHEIINIEIPAGYNLGGSSVPAGIFMGKLKIVYSTDNPWQSGQVITKTADVVATGESGRWNIEVNYDVNTSSAKNGGAVNIKNEAVGAIADIRTHTIEMIDPTDDTPGKMVLIMDRSTEIPNTINTVYTDPAHNEATETFTLVLFDHPKVGSVDGSDIDPEDTIFTNPRFAKVYRWLTRAHTTIDVTGVFQVAGKQSIIIKGVAVDESSGTNTPPVAVDDTYTVNIGDTDLTVLFADGVLSNDDDADGDNLTVTLVSGPTGADDFVLNSDGSFVYTVNAGIAAGAPDDSFIYQVSDGSLNDNAVVTIALPVPDLVSIAVTPVDPSANVLTPTQFTATGFFSDSSQQDITALVTWSSDNATVLVGPSGVALGFTPATTAEIKATLGTISGTTDLTIN